MLLLAGCLAPSGPAQTFPVDLPPASALVPDAADVGLPLESTEPGLIFAGEGAMDGYRAHYRADHHRPEAAVGVTRFSTEDAARAAYARATRDLPDERTTPTLADEAVHAAWNASDIRSEVLLMRASSIVWIVQTSSEHANPPPRDVRAIAEATLAQLK